MGTWQGVLRANSQGQRTVIKILKDDGGVLQGALYPIDEGGGYLPLTGTYNDGPRRHLRSADHPPFSSHRLRRGTVMDQLLSMLHVSFNRPKAASV